MKCEHKVWKTEQHQVVCGRPAKRKIKCGPDGKQSTIDGQIVCGMHARFWSCRGFVVEDT